jgi:hypothetical protein
MESTDAISKLKADLAALRKDGNATVHIDKLEGYLESLNQEAKESLELRKLEHQGSLAQYDAMNRSGLEMFRTVIEAGKEALNAALLINGGAVVAVLSFLGATVGKAASGALGLALTTPLLCFGCGVLSTGLAFAGRYFTQYFYERDTTGAGVGFHVITVVLGIAAYACFGYGIYLSHAAFSNHFAAA